MQLRFRGICTLGDDEDDAPWSSIRPDISQPAGRIRVALINTPLQWGESEGDDKPNRFNFNGFDAPCKTAEAVRVECATKHPTEVGC
jgi:hypothetical protein